MGYSTDDITKKILRIDQKLERAKRQLQRDVLTTNLNYGFDDEP